MIRTRRLEEGVRGFVKLTKIKNTRKTRKWVGGSSPNSDFHFDKTPKGTRYQGQGKLQQTKTHADYNITKKRTISQHMKV